MSGYVVNTVTHHKKNDFIISVFDAQKINRLSLFITDSLREAQCCGDKCRTGDVRIECFCQPIIHHIVVLMRTENPDEQGKCVYKRKLHPLRVGCTPAKQYAPTGRG